MIVLFTVYGRSSPYQGQLHLALARAAPGVPVVDLMADAPAFAPKPAAYLLAALASEFPDRSVCLAVVDPGVGTDRPAVALRADGRWFVGPGNGLLDIVARRAGRAETWRIVWRPEQLSRGFHGRDLFAPVAGRLARGEDISGVGQAMASPACTWPDDWPAIIHLDDFGNAMTGLRGATLAEDSELLVAGQRLPRAGIFAERPAGELF